MLRLTPFMKPLLRVDALKCFHASSRSRYVPASFARSFSTVNTTNQAASATTIPPRIVIYKESFRVRDKTIALHLEETTGGQHLKLVEAVDRRLKRTVCIPSSGIVPFASALMEFSAASDSVDASGAVDIKITSFAPKRVPLRIENQYFLVDMRKSKQGFYLNIENGLNSNSVVVPTEGIASLHSAMQSVLTVSNALTTSAADTPTPRRSVFVSGLSPTTSSEALSTHFAACGQVEKALVLTKTHVGGVVSSLCCGVVQFSSSDDATHAASSLASSALDGSELHYHVIGSLLDSNDMGINEPILGFARVLHPTKVFVGGLPKEITTEEITSLFSQAGTVVSAEVLVDKKGLVLGFAEVEFSDPESVQKAIAKLNGHELEGRWIYVRELFVEPNETIST